MINYCLKQLFQVTFILLRVLNIFYFAKTGSKTDRGQSIYTRNRGTQQ